MTNYEQEELDAEAGNDRYDGFDRGDLDHPENWADEYEMGRIEADDWMPGEVTMWHAVSVMMLGWQALVERCRRLDFARRSEAGEILF